MIDVVIVSSCRKRAIARTHAILDRYASRMGIATWTTKITAEGLETLRRALRRTASRNTAVMCLKREGRGPNARLRQAWTVGNRAFFSHDWTTPVFVTEGTTRSRTVDHNAPAWIADAKRVAAISGLFHDLGKNNAFFAEKILRSQPIADPIRHEWLSTCLVTTMLDAPELDLEQAWTQAVASAKNRCLDKTHRALLPDGVRGPAQAVLACVATHHRLFAEFGDQSKILGPGAFLRDPKLSGIRTSQISPDLNLKMAKPYPKDIKEEVARAMQWLRAEHDFRPNYWRAVTIMARAGLILADHKVSSEAFKGKHAVNEPYANSSQGKLNQPLRWHLQSVGRVAATMVERMLDLENQLDGLDVQAIDSIDGPAEGHFAWQQSAADAIATARMERPNSPMLINVIASTGSGKTRACARLAVRAARGDKVRFSTLLNLRTLTLQTGHVYSQQLDVSDSDLAVVIGDTMTRKAFDAQLKQDLANEDGMVRDFGEDIEIHGEPALLPEWLEHFIGDKANLRAMIGAPVLVSTADYMVAAGEPGAQTRHIMPLLRLLSSDLVLDEIDNYDANSIVAILRLIQMAALCGRSVIASSATLTPTLARAIVCFYEHGARMRAALLGAANPDFVVSTLSDMANPVLESFSTIDAAVANFTQHVASICETLRSNTEPARKALMLNVPKTEKGFFEAIVRGVKHLHMDNAWTSPAHDKRLSVGLVRVANIRTAMKVANALRRDLSEQRAQVVCYHSGLFHGQRLIIERALDSMLKRGAHPDMPVRGHTSVGRHLARPDVQEGLFIVVATPVEEVGRDHDFDWAVIEPSSSQSIVQTVGRVRRHRPGATPKANVGILQHNLKACRYGELGKDQDGSPVFVRPGNETREVGDWPHDMNKLLCWKQVAHGLDARVRFEEHTHLFSELDNKAIEIALAEPERRMLYWPSTWLSAFSYEGHGGKWRLRQNKPNDTWRYAIDEGGRECDGVWSRFDNLDGGWAFHEASRDQAKWLATAGEGYWLSAPLQEIVGYALEQGLTREWALEVEIACDSKNTPYELEANSDGVITRPI
ncbi:MAG: hypothetical protein HIU89_08250 [Proteobacteria bacterium]|nr:hypothetical protein [Pseudomonadota bacterium]